MLSIGTYSMASFSKTLFFFSMALRPLSCCGIVFSLLLLQDSPVQDWTHQPVPEACDVDIAIASAIEAARVAFRLDLLGQGVVDGSTVVAPASDDVFVRLDVGRLSEFHFRNQALQSVCFHRSSRSLFDPLGRGFLQALPLEAGFPTLS